MKFFPEMNLQLQPCSHIVYRPFGAIAGYRRISDPAGRLAVTAIPMEMARRLAASFSQWSACYLLTGDGVVHIGQSACAMQCIAEHAVDPAKAWAAEVFLVHDQEEARTMDWSTRLYMEHRLIELVKEAGLVHFVNPVEPRVLPWRVEHAATLERLVAEGRRLLFDAGCRALDGNLPSQPCAEAGVDDDHEADEAVEFASPMRPMPEVELEFDYCGISARGFADQDGFVVKAGSELRAKETASLRKNIRRLRTDLLAKGVVVPIAGATDRLRLQVDWCFFSKAVAAKFVAGSHVAGTKWVRRAHNSPRIGPAA